MPRLRIRAICSLTLLLLAASACGRRVPPPASGPGAPTARASVEAFLQLATQRRYLDMAWVFGTERGPYVQTVEPGVAERQMFLFSCLLGEQRAEIVDEMGVPGSIGRAVSFSVRLVGGSENIVVPFRAVLGSGNRWYLEQFDIDAITRSRLPISPDCLRSLGVPGRR